MSTINFQQTDSPAICGPIAPCGSTSTLVNTPQARQMDGSAGVAGSTPLTVTLAGSQVGAGVMFESAMNQPNLITWNSGTWTVRLNVTTANSNITLAGASICRIDSSCGAVATIAQVSLADTLATTGVYSYSMSGSASTASASDRVYVVFKFNNGAGTTQSFAFTPDQIVNSPIVGPIPPLVQYLKAQNIVNVGTATGCKCCGGCCCGLVKGTGIVVAHATLFAVNVPSCDCPGLDKLAIPLVGFPGGTTGPQCILAGSAYPCRPQLGNDRVDIKFNGMGFPGCIFDCSKLMLTSLIVWRELSGGPTAQCAADGCFGGCLPAPGCTCNPPFWVFENVKITSVPFPTAGCPNCDGTYRVVITR